MIGALLGLLGVIAPIVMELLSGHAAAKQERDKQRKEILKDGQANIEQGLASGDAARVMRGWDAVNRV